MKPHVCKWWYAYFFDNPLRRLIQNPYKMLRPYVSPGMTVLDVGCGMGFFSLAMARMVGPAGLVVAVDLQQEMLKVLLRRAARAGLAGRIYMRTCTAQDLNVHTRVDFALAFWMVHEALERRMLFEQIRSVMRPGGRLLIAEPRMHVTARHFQETLELAQAARWRCADTPQIRLSRSALLEVAVKKDQQEETTGFVPPENLKSFSVGLVTLS